MLYHFCWCKDVAKIGHICWIWCNIIAYAIVLGGISELLGATLVGGKTSSSLGEKF